MSMALGMMDGQPIMAIGTDRGNIETYAVAPELAQLGSIDAAHTWISANQADPQIRPSNIVALAIMSTQEGTVLASAGWQDKTLTLWDCATLHHRATTPTTDHIMRLVEGTIQSTSMLISVSMDLRCKFWEPETGKLLRERIDERVPDRSVPYESESLWYVDMAFARVAARDLVAIAARDGTIVVIDAGSLAKIAVVSVGYGVLGRSIALAPSGTIAISGTRGITAIKV